MTALGGGYWLEGLSKKEKELMDNSVVFVGVRGEKGYMVIEKKEKTGIKAVQMFLFLKFSETFFV